MKILYRASVGYKWVFAFKKVLEKRGFLFFCHYCFEHKHDPFIYASLSFLSAKLQSSFICPCVGLSSFSPWCCYFCLSCTENAAHVGYSRAKFGNRYYYWSQQPLIFTSSETVQGNVVLTIYSKSGKSKAEIWSFSVFRAASQISEMPVCIWLKCTLQIDASLSSPLMI